ncbi:MAG: NUDIX domain-containing protein [Aeromicrobium sp.]|uniref:NUDIX hydrolase n=1 Tax=Aeromicrobium sp. TaxID=1871063 RepID=UPI0039E36BCF
MDSATTPRRRRLGAYGIAVREGAGRELLVTRMSPQGYPAGAWGLPGGGVHHGESPDVALRRELHEETGLTLGEHRLVDVHDVHLRGPGRDGRGEDYHGVHLLYACRVDTGAVPQVVEVGGSTDLALWTPVEALRDGRPLLPVVEYVLDRLDDLAFYAGVRKSIT